jgi:micrococcal nuclease
MTNPETLPDAADGQKAMWRKRLAMLVSAAIVAATGFGVWYAFAPEPHRQVAAKPDSIFTSSHSGGYDSFAGIAARPMPPCRSESQDNCVVDGQTFRLNGQGIRVANIDSPSPHGACLGEVRRARDAVRTLSDLLDNEPIEIRAKGRDRAGWLVAEIVTRHGDVGADLVRFGVAVPWRRHGTPDTDWCAKGD